MALRPQTLPAQVVGSSVWFRSTPCPLQWVFFTCNPPIAKNYRGWLVCDSFSISLPLYQNTSKNNAVRGLHVNFTNKPKNHEIKCIKTYNVRFVTGWCRRHPARAPTGARTAYRYRISTGVATATEVYTFATPSNGKGCSCMYYYIYYKTYNIRYIHLLKSFACKLFAAVQHPAALARTCKPQCPLFFVVYLVMITHSPVLARV